VRREPRPHTNWRQWLPTISSPRTVESSIDEIELLTSLETFDDRRSEIAEILNFKTGEIQKIKIWNFTSVKKIDREKSKNPSRDNEIFCYHIPIALCLGCAPPTCLPVSDALHAFEATKSDRQVCW
jgi:hypothetical protein